jgi:DNA-binding CsgD family transcriptional regulator
MNKLLLTFICILQFFPFTGISQNKAAHILNFDKENYGGANKNWSVAFGKNGYTYIGNSIGLIEFDGVSWHLNASPNDFAVRSIAIDENNRIYTGGYRELGYWERNTYGKLEYFSLTSMVEEHFPGNEEFWHIFIINNKVFFQSFSGIYIYENGIFSVINVDGFITCARVLNDELLIALKDKGIFKISDNGYHPFLKNSFFQGKSISFFEQITPEKILLGTANHGTFSYNLHTDNVEPWAEDQSVWFSRNNINKGVVSCKNNIIIGTILGGLKIFDKKGNQKHHLNVESGLQSNTVHSLKSDSLGNIWVVSDKGLDLVSFSSPEAYTMFRHKELGAMYSAALYDGYLYAGTNQGLYRRLWAHKNEPFRLIPGTQQQVWDCRVLDDKIFVGHNTGTFLVDDHKTRIISHHAGGYAITRVPKQPDYLLQCTYNDLVIFSKETGQWRARNLVKGFSDLIRFVEFDHRNNLWASHRYQGVYRIRLNEELDSAEKVTYFGKNSAMWRQGAGLRTFKIENRIVFTNEEELFTYDDLNDSIVPYHFLNQRLGKYATSFRISNGPDHHYWFINASGIALFRILGTDIEMIKEFPISLFKNDLIPQEENIVPIDAYRAILCLEDGYALLNAKAPDSGSLILNEKPSIREVLIQGPSGEARALSPYQKKIIIPYSSNNLILRYSFPLLPGENIRYQYKIDGLSNEWSSLTDYPRFVINRIPTGDYTIKVRAVNSWERTSENQELDIQVKPPWYQSATAIAGYALIFMALFFLGKQITIKRVRLNEKHMREEKERELIRLRNEKLQSELSFKSRQLANSAMGIVKKNEFLISLKDKLKKQKEQLSVRFPDKYYNELIKKIDSNISGDDDWKLFEHNFNQAHETFLQSLKTEYPDLTPSDLRLCAFLRINLPSKEIAPLLGISVRGVENHRYRVRKKLNLSADTDLTEFILSWQNGHHNNSQTH